MFKFFRHLRQNLLNEGKTSKYIKYAIGEIVLVVIGILIALSLNTWKEQNKNKASELDYYCRLFNDLNLEKQLISESIKSADERTELGRKILIDLNSKTKSKNELLNDYLMVQRANVYVPIKVTFDFLIASGDIKLISDNSINSSLTIYFGLAENIVEQMNQNRDEIVKTTFGYDSKTEFGYQEFDYINKALGTEIISHLPNIDWTKDSTNKYYTQFQDNLVFIIAMSERQKQHLGRILQEMKQPYQLLKNKCAIQTKNY